MGPVKKNPYKVPAGYKGFWLDSKTFIIVKKDEDIKAVKAKFDNRKGAGWDLGYVEKHGRQGHQVGIRVRKD